MTQIITLKLIIMKATTSNQQKKNLELKELSKVELMVVKTAIAIFGAVLNVCVLQLVF